MNYSGGFLTGKYLAPTAKVEPGSHFDKNWVWSRFYRERYDHTAEPVRELQAVCEKHGLSLAEATYRWLEHHSALQPSDQGLILGISRTEQLEAAILDRSAP